MFNCRPIYAAAARRLLLLMMMLSRSLSRWIVTHGQNRHHFPDLHTHTHTHTHHHYKVICTVTTGCHQTHSGGNFVKSQPIYFTARRVYIARYMLSCGVCPFACRSHACIVSKQQSNSLRTPNMERIFLGIPLIVVVKQERAVEKSLKHRYKLYEKSSCTRIRQSFFSERVVNVWNCLPAQIDFSSMSIVLHTFIRQLGSKVRK